MIDIRKREILADIRHRLILLRTQKAYLDKQEQSLLNDLHRIQITYMYIPKGKFYDEDFKF